MEINISGYVQLKGLDMSDISLKQAQVAIEEAIKKAQGLGYKMNVVVVDAGANIKAFARMDGAWLGSIDIAMRKARTARLFDMQTGELGKLSQPGGPLYSVEHSNGGLITFPGGVPIMNADDEIIGGIGVSGRGAGMPHEVSRIVAEAGAHAVLNL